MTKRERVLAAAAGEKTDRIPCTYHAAEVVNRRLYDRLSLSSYIDLLHFLGSDIVDIRHFIDPAWVGGQPKKYECAPGIFRNYLGFVTQFVQTAYGEVEEHCDFLLADAEQPDEIADFPFPSVDWFDFSDFSQRLRAVEDFAVMATGPSVFQHPALVRGLDNLLCDFAANPEMADFLMDQYTDFYLALHERMFEACPGQIALMRIADDFGMQDRPLISVSAAERYVFPRVKKLSDMAHAYGVKVMVHSCGSVDGFIPGWLAAGVDILDPVQPLAKNMELGSLKARFGDRLCFHGGIDTQHTLPAGSPEDVRREVRQRMSLFGNDGGYIIAPAHTLQPDVPEENILAMYTAIREVNEELGG